MSFFFSLLTSTQLLLSSLGEVAQQQQLAQQTVKPLPGELNQIPVFNSNSPELIESEGILLSTFPGRKKTFPNAHLNFPLTGRFDIFAHHVAKPPTPGDLRTLYLGILLHNPSLETVTVDILSGASYLSQPDAPFIDLPSVLANPDGNVYAGPGSRVMNELLRDRHQEIFPQQLTIPPQSSRLILNHPIPVRPFDPPLNGRSTYIRLKSNGTIYAASLAKYAPKTATGKERAPYLSEWKAILQNENLVTPRDQAPTPPQQQQGIIYGRVAGVSGGNEWETTIPVNLPSPGKAIAYGISTLTGGRLGTDQVQTAPMLVRYPDTAYQAHGNYGVEYDLTFQLQNRSNEAREVSLSFATPVKQDQLNPDLQFLDPPTDQVFFRGTVKISDQDEEGNSKTRYFHLVQNRGEKGEPLVKLTVPPQSERQVKVQFLYPPDATPPQVLMIRTQN
ncbi:hypothetical protein PCC7418_2208 [Halothece sp. PCC 7418]|uniref:DUF3370 domain-containing protein n=1 Tax=Halothece sp. (strain PCC 7418) TaxID=65093 RepID=UPI0002A0622E|nr:DUF3370 domain-containing protein [Halothece sp. PCC 7418]AFZ44362.1 hypothetical protein PCC7418_2208 [Halothece sp. PCC 7418]